MKVFDERKKTITSEKKLAKWLQMTAFSTDVRSLFFISFIFIVHYHIKKNISSFFLKE